MYLFSKSDKLDKVYAKIKETALTSGFTIKKIDCVEQLHVSENVKKYCFDIFTS